MSAYLCNLVIPGAGKSGTSALHEALAYHPEICMSTCKEPFFFCLNQKYKQGSELHNSLFDRSELHKIFGESSTGYLISNESIQRIANCLKDPKIIIILREPVERAFSHYRWRCKLGLEKRSFLRAVQKNGYGYDPEKPDKYGYMSYLQFSKYSVYIPMWLSTFSKDNVLILNSKSLRENTDLALAECSRFLVVSPFSIKEKLEVNKTDDYVIPPRKIFSSLARLLPADIKETGVYQRFRSRLLDIGVNEPPKYMTDEERAFVEDQLSDDMAYFSSLFEKRMKMAEGGMETEK